LVRWDREECSAPKATLRPDRFLITEPTTLTDSGSTHTAGPRNLQVVNDNALIFSAANMLFLTDLEGAHVLPTESPSEIVSIIPDEGRVIVIHEDGTLYALDPISRSIGSLTRRGTRIRSAGILPWLGSTRLLLAGDDGPVNCIGFEDQLVSEYQSIHRGMKVITGSSDLVAGVSSDRQRLILWNSWDGRQPLTEVYLTGLTRHRIADVAFG
jgi:hypothetical protein